MADMFCAAIRNSRAAVLLHRTAGLKTIKSPEAAFMLAVLEVHYA